LQGCTGKGWRTHEPVLHARQFALGHFGMSPAKIVGNNQPKNRITEKLKGFVMELTRLLFIARGHLLVRP